MKVTSEFRRFVRHSLQRSPTYCHRAVVAIHPHRSEDPLRWLDLHTLAPLVVHCSRMLCNRSVNSLHHLTLDVQMSLFFVLVITFEL